MISVELKFKNDASPCTIAVSPEVFIRILRGYKLGLVEFLHASIKNKTLDVNHLINILTL